MTTDLPLPYRKFFTPAQSEDFIKTRSYTKSGERL